MPDLPQELVAVIISAILQQNDPGTYHLAPLACINRNWQAAVERQTWNHISIDVKAHLDEEGFEKLQRYTEGSTRQNRRSYIHVLSIGWFYEMQTLQQDATMTFSKTVTREDSDESIPDQDKPWDFPEIIPFQDDDQFELEAGNQYDPDWERVNAALWSDTSDDDGIVGQSANESHGNNDYDTDSQQDAIITEPLDKGTAGAENSSERRLHTKTDTDLDTINAAISSDESEAEEDQEPEESREELLQHLYSLQTSFFSYIQLTWHYLASGDEQTNIKRINLQLAGNTFNNAIYQGLRHDEARMLSFLQSTLRSELSLATLPRLKKIFVDGRRALVYWPALIAIRVAMASELPPPVVEFRAWDFGKWWKKEVVDGLHAEGTYSVIGFTWKLTHFTATALRDELPTSFVEISCRS